jgi:hypothetical protein
MHPAKVLPYRFANKVFLSRGVGIYPSFAMETRRHAHVTM